MIKFRPLFSALSVGFALAGTASAQTIAPEARVPIEAAPLTLDPDRLSEAHEFRIAQDLFEGLTTESATGAIIPGVASSWTVSRDGRKWTFHLRPNEKWSDGSALTAEDFVYSFRRAISPGQPSPAAAVLRPIEGADALLSGGDADPCNLGVTAANALTLVIKLAHPTPWLPQLLAHFAAMPVPEKAIEAYGDDWIQPAHFVGNGAFRLERWVPGGEIVLKRNPYFHDAAAVRVERVLIRPAPELGQALAALQTGDFDAVTVRGAELATAQAQMPQQVATQVELATAYIFPNVANGPTRWPALRQALSMALDREWLIRDIEQTNSVPAYEVISPTLPGYTPAGESWAGEPLNERVAKAQRLIADRIATYLNAPLRLTFSDTARNRRMAQAIANSWTNALSIRVILRPLPEKEFLGALSSHDFELALVAWDPDFADASSTLAMFRSDAGAANFGNYANPHFDTLMHSSNTVLEAKARARLLREAEQQLLDDAAVIPLKHGVVNLVISPRLKGWVANPLGRHPSRFITIVPGAVSSRSAKARAVAPAPRVKGCDYRMVVSGDLGPACRDGDWDAD